MRQMGAEIAVFGIYLDSLILIIFVKVYQIKLRELPDIKRCNIRVLYLYNIKIVFIFPTWQDRVKERIGSPDTQPEFFLKLQTLIRHKNRLKTIRLKIHPGQKFRLISYSKFGHRK